MKKKINEEKLISIIYANFRDKGRKVNDWISLANVMKKLTDYYGGLDKMAEISGLSKETIREALKLLELPKEVQNLVKEGKLKHEVAWRIESIDGAKNQIRVAKSMIGLKSHNARDLVRRFRINPKLNIESHVKKVKEPRPGREEINLIIIPLGASEYSKMKELAKLENKSVDKFILENLVQKFLGGSRK